MLLLSSSGRYKKSANYLYEKGKIYMSVRVIYLLRVKCYISFTGTLVKNRKESEEMKPHCVANTENFLRFPWIRTLIDYPFVTAVTSQVT